MNGATLLIFAVIGFLFVQFMIQRKASTKIRKKEFSLFGIRVILLTGANNGDN